MKSSIYEQFAIVKEDSASLFTEKLNEQIRCLRNYSPVVNFSDSDPLCAYIRYSVTEKTPETIGEASIVDGVSFVCAQCPYFKPILKDDETEDKRCKFGDCEHAEMGRTIKTSTACEKLYQLIKDGDVKIVFREEA